MHPLAHMFSIWIAALGGILRSTLSRLLLGATLPSWTWRTEWAVASTRSVIAAAAQDRANPLIASIGSRVKVPLSGFVIGTVRIRPWTSGSVSGDYYERVGSTMEKPTILYFHGGGYAFGNPGTHREHIARLVERTGANIVAPVYRLSPLFRFPAAVNDAVAAYRQLLAEGCRPADIVVSGDSAGGGLAIAMVHRVRSEKLPMPAGLMLFSPYVDLSHTSHTNTTNANTDYLPVREMTSPNDWYVEPQDIDNPEASPIRADLTGFPPMLIHAGGAEMLLTDSIRLAEHAERDGVRAELLIAREMPHVWPALVPWEPASRKTLEQCAQWLAEVMGRAEEKKTGSEEGRKTRR